MRPCRDRESRSRWERPPSPVKSQPSGVEKLSHLGCWRGPRQHRVQSKLAPRTWWEADECPPVPRGCPNLLRTHLDFIPKSTLTTLVSLCPQSCSSPYARSVPSHHSPEAATECTNFSVYFRLMLSVSQSMDSSTVQGTEKRKTDNKFRITKCKILLVWRQDHYGSNLWRTVGLHGTSAAGIFLNANENKASDWTVSFRVPSVFSYLIFI